MWKNTVQPDIRLWFAWWPPKATEADTELRRTASPPQQWLREGPWILCYTYIACLVTVSSYLLDRIQPCQFDLS